MDDKRQYIIEKTAHQLVLKVTTHSNFNIDDIATQCCVSKKTIYKCFENKQALFEESYAFLFQKFKQSLFVVDLEVNTTQNLNQILSSVYKNLCVFTLVHRNKPNFYSHFDKEIYKLSHLINNTFFKTSDVCLQNTFSTLMHLMCHPFKANDVAVVMRYNSEEFLQNITTLVLNTYKCVSCK